MKKFLFWMATATLLKYSYFGYMYYPLLDDHIQYGVYTMYPKSFILFDVGTIYTRPLASVADVFVWGNLSLSLCLIIITAFHFMSSVFFWKAFDKIGIKLSPLFFVIYLLFPPLSESTYWLSASTRLVTGMLMTSLAMYCFVNKKRAGYYIFFLFSMLFYEQIASFSFVLIFLLYMTKKKIPIYPCTVLLAVALYYFSFRNFGAFGLRENAELTFSDVIQNIFNVYTNGIYKMFENGFTRSCEIVLKKPLYTALIIITAFLCGKHSYKSNKNVKCIYIGALLFLTSYAPFFVSGGAWISLRSLFAPVTALAIILGFFPVKKITALLTLVFLIYNTGETYDYYMAGKNDAQIIKAITDSGKDYAVKKYVPESSVTFHEHIESVTASDWALSGALQNAGRVQNVGSKCYNEYEEQSMEIFDCKNFLWYNK